MKRLVVNPVWVSLQYQGPILVIGQNNASHFKVVIDQIPFGVSIFGPIDFLEMGQLYVAAPDSNLAPSSLFFRRDCGSRSFESG